MKLVTNLFGTSSVIEYLVWNMFLIFVIYTDSYIDYISKNGTVRLQSDNNQVKKVKQESVVI